MPSGDVFMSSITVSLVSFACVLGAALLGRRLGRILPQQHISGESKGAITSAMKLVSTMAALVLGLLVASAKGFYDTQSAALTQLSSNIVMLDRTLSHYGPETKKVRDLLHDVVVSVIDQISSKDPGTTEHSPKFARTDPIFDEIQQLSPKNDMQRFLENQALSIATAIAQTRWSMYEQAASSISLPLIAMLLLWLVIIFVSFGMLSPSNGTVVSSLFVSALAVSCAIALIFDMYTPYEGLMHISSAPLQAALAQLGQ